MSLSLRVFAPFAFGYLLASVFRPITAVIAPDIVKDIGLDAASLGFLASAFFITAAASQLPLGILLDRYGPRPVNALLLCVTALGAVLFAIGHDVAILALGRAFIGIGVASCMASSFKAFALWYPPERLPLVNGLALAAGGIGTLMGTVPVEVALRYVDWRTVHLSVGGLVALSGIVLFVTVPRREFETKGETFRGQLNGLGVVLSSLAFWRIAPLVTVSMAAYANALQLWAGPWLHDVAGYERAQVASTMLILTGSTVVAFPLGGYLSSKLQHRGISAMTFAVGCMTIFMFVQIALLIELTSLTQLVWLLFGVFGPLSLSVYAALNQQFPKAMAGRVNTSMTLLWMAFAFCVQTGFGAILDQFPHSAAGGYAPQGYQTGFAILIALQLVTLGWYVAMGQLHAVSPGTPAKSLLRKGPSGQGTR